jgi:hypothetical protein
MVKSTCDDLDDTIPNIVFYFSVLDEFNHHIDVPNEILCEFFSQDGDFEDQVIMDVRIYSILEVA